LKLNRIYYKHLWKSIILVAVGLGFIIKEEYPNGTVSDNFFILIMVVLSAFFGFPGIITLFMRYNKGQKFRRKFIYCFFGVANVAIGILSILFSILHGASAGILSIVIYIASFLVGVAILIDIFFGKRAPKQEREVLIT
jgi:low temperature requirement protein LtrA